MKKTLIKIIAVLFTATTLAAASYATLVFYPQILFSQETEIGQIGVLSEQPVDPGFESAVAEALSVISTSELYDPNFEMGIVLAHDHLYHRLTPGKELAYAIGPYAVVAGIADSNTNTLYWEKSPVRMNLTTTLAHELVHCLQGNRHGYAKLNRAMMPWKREGYAEYIAHRESRLESGQSLVESIDQLLSENKSGRVKGWMTAEDGFDYPITYVRFRLMTEFLFDVEGMTYDSYIETAEFHDVYQRMIAWRRSRQL